MVGRPDPARASATRCGSRDAPTRATAFCPAKHRVTHQAARPPLPGPFSEFFSPKGPSGRRPAARRARLGRGRSLRRGAVPPPRPSRGTDPASIGGRAPPAQPMGSGGGPARRPRSALPLAPRPSRSPRSPLSNSARPPDLGLAAPPGALLSDWRNPGQSGRGIR